MSEHLDVDSRSVHAFIIGEHGDSELAVWSSANVAGIDIHDFCELRGHYEHDAAMERIYKEVRDSAYEIIERKGATYYGVAMAVGRIAESIIRDENSVLPVSSLWRANMDWKIFVSVFRLWFPRKEQSRCLRFHWMKKSTRN